MRGVNPYERTSLEVQILGQLNDIGHSVTLRSLITQVNPDLNTSIVCTVFDFKNEGLVTVRDLTDGEQMVQLTPQGKALLLEIYSGKAACD